MENLDTTLGDNQWVYGTLGDAVTSATSNISLNKIKEDDGPYAVFGARGYMQNVSFFHQENDYLAIIKDGAGIGRVSELPAKSSVLATMQYLLPKTGYELRFIKYFLESIDFDQYRTGSTIPHIYFKDYKSEPFPILSITEQQRIIAILDEVFADIEQVRAKTEQNLKNARELFESYLQQVFSKDIKNYNQVALAEITKTISDGDHSAPPKSSEGIPFITISNIDKNTNEIDFSSTFKVPEDYYEKLKPNRKPIAGDVLYTVTGSYGIPVLVKKEKKFCFQRHIGLIRPNSKAESEWLYYLLMSPIVFKQAEDGATGTAQKTVSLKVLRNILVPETPLGIQKEEVKKLKLVDAKTKNLESVYSAKLAALDELKKSILQKAFSGELTKISNNKIKQGALA